MIRRSRLAGAIAGLAIAAVPGLASPTDTPVLLRVADVPLPGPAVRFDYQTIDTTANRLYFSHMNAGEPLVLDLQDRKIVGTVTDLPRVTGVWCVPGRGKVYASVPGHHHVAIIAAGTLGVEARVGEIGFPMFAPLDGASWFVKLPLPSALAPKL